MEKLEIKKENIVKAYNEGSGDVKKTLKRLFPELEDYVNFEGKITTSDIEDKPFIGLSLAPCGLADKCIMADSNSFDVEIDKHAHYHVIKFKRKPS